MPLHPIGGATNKKIALYCQAQSDIFLSAHFNPVDFEPWSETLELEHTAVQYFFVVWVINLGQRHCSWLIL